MTSLLMYSITPYDNSDTYLDTVYVGMALVGCLGLAVGFLIALILIETNRKISEVLSKLFPKSKEQPPHTVAPQETNKE